MSDLHLAAALQEIAIREAFLLSWQAHHRIFIWSESYRQQPLTCCRSFYGSPAFQGSMEFFAALLSHRQEPGRAQQRFLMQAMMFLHAVLTCKAITSGSHAALRFGASQDEASFAYAY